MKILYRVLLSGFSVVFMLASLCCRLPWQPAASATDKDLKSGSHLVFFAGWRFPDKGILLAKNKAKSSGNTYFLFASPGAEPAVYDTPEVDLRLNSGFGGSELVSHSGKQKVTTRREEDHFGKLLNAEVTLTETAAPQRVVTLAAGTDATWTIRGWSADDKFIVFTANGKAFFVNPETKEKIDVKPQSVLSVSQIVMNEKGNGFYIVGEGASAIVSMDYFDFSTQKSSTILSVKGEAIAGVSDWQGELSPDQKILAVFVSVHAGTNAMHLDAENSLRLYDFQTGVIIKQYELPKGEMKLQNKTFFSGPAWRGDNQEIAFHVMPLTEEQEFSSINIQDGKITQWFSSGR
jgi:uncharacterized protein YlzI (FlbEa/FlbD family)